MHPRTTQHQRLWRAWLGTTERPPPLDRFLSTRLRDLPKADRTPAFLALNAACAWGVTAAAALHPHGLEAGLHDLLHRPVLTALRQAGPELVALSAALAGLPASPRARELAARTVRTLQGHTDLPHRCLRWGVPPAWAEHLAPRGEDWVNAWLPLQHQRPPLHLRPRSPQATQALLDEGFTVTASAGGLEVLGHRPIERTRALREGLAVVQDLGSQQVGAAVALKRGHQVWDMCAGAGGKTLQLADSLQGKGAIHATDVDPRRLKRLKPRVKQAKLADHVRVRAWDGETVPDFGREVSKRGGFHAVLVDAPCSATGTWRRNPDARLRSTPTELGQHATLQGHLLDLAASALRPRGLLVYATCSWWRAEDEAVIEAFLSRHPHLSLSSSALVGAPTLNSDTLFVATLTEAS